MECVSPHIKYKSDRRINYERHMSLSTCDSLLNHPLEYRTITDNSSMIWVSCGIRPANMSKGTWSKAILFLYFHDWTSRCKCMFFVHSQESERLLEYFRNWHYWQPVSHYLEWFHDKPTVHCNESMYGVSSSSVRPGSVRERFYCVQFTELQIFLCKRAYGIRECFFFGKILFGKCTQVPNFLDYLCF